jgi:hypothetical protein
MQEKILFVKKIINILTKMIVMVIVFMITITLVNKFENRQYNNLAMEMEAGKLPLVYVKYDGEYINCLHGYTMSVDTTLLRDAITPVDDSKSIQMLIDDNYEYVTGYGYELRSIAGDSLIEDGELQPSGSENGYNIVNVEIRMDIEPDMEYMLVLKLQGEEDEVARYYTRVVVSADYHAAELLKFADEFNAATFDFDEYEEKSFIYPYQQEYLERTDGNKTESTMGHITLDNSYDDLLWSGVEPMKITSAIPTIKEIDVNYAVIQMNYITMNVQEDAEPNYYAISEYYRLSYNQDGTITLMNFDRYIDEYFNRVEVDSANNLYEIGVVNGGNVEYRYSSDNKKISFVRNGQLWLYDYSNNQIYMVFGFWMDDIENIRDTYSNYDINIISMDDDCNITFAVYGYMNRGSHEGKLGISLFSYKADQLELDELLFVECNEPYAVMKEELSRLTYYDGENFYFLMNNKVTCINVEDKKMSYYVDDVSAKHVFVSYNMEVMAYYTSDIQTENQIIHLINFKTGETYTFDAGASRCLTCYGFNDTDMIYGISDISDSEYSIDTDSFEKENLDDEILANIPAYKLFIVNADGNVVKEYEKDGNYIVNVTVEDDVLYMTRAVKNGNSFTLASDDFITFKEDEDNPVVKTLTKTSAEGIKKMYFSFPSNIYLTYVPYVNITKNKIADKTVNMVVTIEDEYADYMLYDNLGLAGIYQVAGEAINDAIDIEGIVISKKGEVVYRQSESQEYNTIASAIFHHSSGSVEKSLEDCLYMTIIYQGVTVEFDEVEAYSDPVAALTELGKYEGVDVSGISLDMVFGYVSDGIPVISRIDDGRYVLVVSYNSEAVRYYDPVIDDEVRVSREEYENSMDKWNSELYTYINN